MATIRKSDLEKGDDLYEHHRIQVDPGQSPVRIDRFLMERLEKVSRNRIQNAIRARCILVDGKEVKPNYKVRPNEMIVIILPGPPREDYEIIAEDIPLDIVYEDEDILIVNKKAGMVVHPGTNNYSGTLVNALAYHLKGSTMPIKAGNRLDRPGLVHRIDKNTSGLLVVAKNDLSMTILAKQFFDHSIEREYLALVWGTPENNKDTITGHIGRHPKDRTKMCVFDDVEKGKHAITHFEVLEDLYYVSLIKCKLETGRTHQIRVHMSHKGHPIFNDDRYGGGEIVKGTVFTKYKQFVQNNFKLLPRQALHAKSLGFIHPVTKEKMYFEAPLPNDFEDVLSRWRNYLENRKN